MASDTGPWFWPQLSWAPHSGPATPNPPIAPCASCCLPGGFAGSCSKSRGPVHLWRGAWPGSWLLHGMMGRRRSYFGVCYPFLPSCSIFFPLSWQRWGLNLGLHAHMARAPPLSYSPSPSIFFFNFKSNSTSCYDLREWRLLGSCLQTSPSSLRCSSSMSWWITSLFGILCYGGGLGPSPPITTAS